MFDNLRRRAKKANKFVAEHDLEVMFAAGFVAGVTGVLYVKLSLPSRPSMDIIKTSPEVLQELVNDPSGAIEWVSNNGRDKIYLLNSANPILSQG